MAGLATAFKSLTDALDRLAIPYFIGGSLASSIHGVARATVDVDLVAGIDADQAEALAAELGSGFYADAEMIRQAVRLGRPFNLIHYATAYKFDIFPAAGDPYTQEQLNRRRVALCDLLEGVPLAFPVASPEDTILAKLRWLRLGGGVSEQQWRDVVGVVRVRGSGLDLSYLQEWAPRLGVADLLERALADGGLTESSGGRPR